MSSATVDTGRGRPRTITIALPRAEASAAIAAGTALLLVLAAFEATGGLRLEPTTRILILLMLGGGALCCTAAVRAPRAPGRPLYGTWSMLAFLLLTAFTAASIVWSLTPSDSWVEANRTFAYACAFAGAIALARLAPRAWAGLLAGIAAGCLIISLWAVLTKVFPSALAADEIYARLRAPFEYWNSVGLMAALGVPPLLWLGTRRTGHPFANALAWPAIALLLLCVMISYSRGGLIAVVVGPGLWLAVVPLRRSGAELLACAVAGAAPLVLWAFNQDGLTTDEAPMAARVDAGHELGVLVLLVCTVLYLVGLASLFARAQRPLTPGRRLPLRVALGALAVLVVALAVAAAAAPGDLGEQVSRNWTKLTDPNAPTPANTPDRLVATSSVRARYWDEALDVHAVSPWVGTGAGAYAIARTRFRSDTLAVRHAHGYVPQTLADLGWAGLGVSLLLVLAWSLSAGRVTGMRRRDRGLPFDAERVAMLTLVTVVVLFGVHSAIDWTWFVPANILPALLAAGWIVGRPPLRERLLGAADPPAERTEVQRTRLLRRPLAFARRAPAASLAALLIALLALSGAWTAYQPVRSVHADDAAFDRLSLGADKAASSIAGIAVDRNPLSVDARFDQAAIEQGRGRNAAAEEALQAAVRLEPANAETWRRLGRFHLDVSGETDKALDAFQAAYYLDPQSPISKSDLLEATRVQVRPEP